MSEMEKKGLLSKRSKSCSSRQERNSEARENREDFQSAYTDYYNSIITGLTYEAWHMKYLLENSICF